ncbi:MAG: hypothetical protein WAW69_17335 [Polaromonas sp.]
MSERDIFSEFFEGFAAMQAHREAALSQYLAKASEVKPGMAALDAPDDTVSCHRGLNQY